MGGHLGNQTNPVAGAGNLLLSHVVWLRESRDRRPKHRGRMKEPERVMQLRELLAVYNTVQIDDKVDLGPRKDLQNSWGSDRIG
jgi:hypothetical protein